MSVVAVSSEADKNKEQEDKNPSSSTPKKYKRRHARRSGDGDGDGSSIWLISFTDVMALMLTFFVLLFAMSNPKTEDWERLTQNIQQNFNKYYGQALNRGAQDTISIEKVDFSRALDLSYLKALIDSLMTEEESLQNVTLFEQPGYLIVSLPDTLLFEPGSVSLGDGATQALFTLSEMLARIKNRVEITGHSDPRPVRSQDFPSNWELSYARAGQVAAALYRYGYDKPIQIRGAAAGRYGDLADRLPEDQRLDLSRRVDIIIMEDDGKRLKVFDLGGL